MKKLDSLKIGAFRYSVVYVKDLKRDEVKLDGHLHHSQTRISLDADMNAQATTQTLLHETIHAIATQIGRQELREGIVDALAFGIYQVLRDNPELVRMITK
jgi:hypothetical protein